MVLDTNVFVAAGFNRGSAAAALLDMVRTQRLCLAWDEETRAETRHILERIPRLDWAPAAALFAAGRRFATPPIGARFDRIGDPADRKFAALAQAAGAALISNDSDLLSVRDSLPVAVHTPRDYLAALEG